MVGYKCCEASAVTLTSLGNHLLFLSRFSRFLNNGGTWVLVCVIFTHVPPSNSASRIPCWGGLFISHPLYLLSYVYLAYIAPRTKNEYISLNTHQTLWITFLQPVDNSQISRTHIEAQAGRNDS